MTCACIQVIGYRRFRSSFNQTALHNYIYYIYIYCNIIAHDLYASVTRIVKRSSTLLQSYNIYILLYYTTAAVLCVP